MHALYINLRELVSHVIHYHVAELLARQHPDVIRESLRALKNTRQQKFSVVLIFVPRGGRSTIPSPMSSRFRHMSKNHRLRSRLPVSWC